MPANGGDSPSIAKSLLQGAVNAVPGAYYSGLAQQQYRQGNYGAAALYGAESLADAALGFATLGAATRFGAAARAAETVVPAAAESASRAVGAGLVRGVAKEAGASSLVTEGRAAGALEGKPPPPDSAGSVAYKLETYLLDPNHVDGGPKADWFKRALGFTRENSADLAKQLVFDESQAVQHGVNQYGTLFRQTINVTGANGCTIPVTTGWIAGSDGVPRLTTAFPKWVIKCLSCMMSLS